MTLVPLDPTNAVAVTDYLTKARDWLSTAVETSTPHGIADAKAELSIAAEATKQLDLSQEIRDDAVEMVRRAEFALAKSIRKGQDEGSVAKQGHAIRPAVHHEDYEAPSVPTDFATKGELYGARGEGILKLADAIDSQEDLDAALSVAKAEGNLSRANVVRIAEKKSGIAKAKPRKPLPDTARNAGWDLRKAVERLERIAADDRFGANKEQVATHLRSHLTNAVEVCQDLLDRFNN